MKSLLVSLVVLPFFCLVIGGCATDIELPTPTETDSGASPAPTDSGPAPAPADAGTPTPPPPPPADSGTPTPPPPACGAGLTNCTGTCRNLQNDNVNCGACNNHCFGGATCMTGRCVAPPPPADAGVPTPPADARILRVRGTFGNEPCPGGWQFVTWGPRGSSIPGVEPFRRIEADDAPEYRSPAGGELYLPRLTRAWAGYIVLKGYCPSTAQWYGGYNLCATAANTGITLIQTVEGGDNLASATNVCRDVYISGSQYGIMIPLSEGRNTCPSGWRGYPF